MKGSFFGVDLLNLLLIRLQGTRFFMLYIRLIY